MSAPDSLPRPIAEAGWGLFGERFRMGDLLGSGSTAAVFQAEDLLHLDAAGRPVAVAVKGLHSKFCADEASRDAFLAEADRLEVLRHPNVAGVHGCGLHEAGGLSMAWIALDLLDGSSLVEWMRHNGPLSVADAVAVSDGMLAGLARAHSIGLVHRDIAPGNVMLVGAQRDRPLTAEMVRVLDFGLAAAAGRTTVGGDVLLVGPASEAKATVVGNAGFISPEQALGRPVGPSADLYQVGAVLYYLLTAQQPFPRADRGEAVQAALSAPPPVPSALVPSTRPLDSVIAKALAKDPRRRFADAEAFREALAGISTVPPIAVTRVFGAEVGAAARGDDGPGSRDGVSDRGPTRCAPRSANAPLSGAFAVFLVVGAVVALVAWTLLGARGGMSPLAGVTPTPTSSVAADSAVPSPTQTRSQAQVPALYGDLETAQTALRAAGLSVGKLSRKNSAEPAGRVLSQLPAAGKPSRVDGTVDLTVATGRNRVPQVAGMTVVAAVATLESAGFRVQFVPDESSWVASGTAPRVGTELLVGVTVAVQARGSTVTPEASSDVTATSTATP